MLGKSFATELLPRHFRVLWGMRCGFEIWNTKSVVAVLRDTEAAPLLVRCVAEAAFLTTDKAEWQPKALNLAATHMRLCPVGTLLLELQTAPSFLSFSWSILECPARLSVCLGVWVWVCDSS